MRWFFVSVLMLMSASLTAADLAVEIDGQPVAGVLALTYDAGNQRLWLALGNGPPCAGSVIDPMAGQLGLQLGNTIHAVSGAVAYDADPLSPVVRIETQLGSLACPGDPLFADRFQAPG